MSDLVTTLVQDSNTNQVTPLTDLARGESGVICELRLEREDAALLRAMGVCAGSRVRVKRVGDPIVIAVTNGRVSSGRFGGGSHAPRADGIGGCRIGLARELAERVYVASAGAS